MDDPGGSTVDLGPRRTTAPPTPERRPDKKERRLRRFGTISLISGVTIEVALGFASLAMAVVSDNNAYSNPTAELFGVLSHFAFVSLAASLIAIGGVEWLSRRHRAQASDNAHDLADMRQTITTVADLNRATDRNRILLERLTIENRERYTEFIGIVGAVPGRMLELTESYSDVVQRLDGIEKAVQEIPDYSRGIKDGLQLRRGYIDPDTVDPQ